MAEKEYPVLQRIERDGKLYDPIAEPDITLKIEEKEAKPLIEKGILADPSEASPPSARRSQSRPDGSQPSKPAE